MKLKMYFQKLYMYVYKNQLDNHFTDASFLGDSETPSSLQTPSCPLSECIHTHLGRGCCLGRDSGPTEKFHSFFRKKESREQTPLAGKAYGRQV